MNRKEMLATLGGAPLAVLALAREGRAGEDETPLSPAREAIRARYFPNVVLTTHEGKRVRFFDDLIRDKIAVIGLMYANCQRSEEHTSELQSHSDLVCRLLLEKKNKKITPKAKTEQSLKSWN